MAPIKRKAEQPLPAAAAPATGRVTRSSAKLAAAGLKTAPVVEVAEKKQKETKKPKGKKQKKEEVVAEVDGGASVTDKGTVVEPSSKTIIVEHCKQCNSFKTRANLVKEGLEKRQPGITVILNPEKPRRGCFEIREEGGKKFISLLDMKRPFKPMKDLDMEKVISDIAEEIST
ncbi:hypothetical protein PIB30_071027 [Stylosanthes scabra]|uniref:Selenoprotein H n=1 Tax=Stylosanthes scabra TaxID=79078 RepID=A0ABU6QNQ3_9FABA|nr:hypothetical protein [Stylosanthes scabra]